jgi:replicative DNA helicase
MASPEHNRSLRNPPQNIDAEKALLGAIILKPDSMHDISVTIYPESFYADKHSAIFDAIQKIFSKGDPIDTVSVVTKLKDMNQLDRVGGASYITELIETVPAAGNAMYYAEQVQAKSTLRGLIHAADDIAEIGYSDPEVVDEALDQAEKKIFQATQAPSAQKFRAIGSALTEAWERFEHLTENPDDKRGVPSGFTALGWLSKIRPYYFSCSTLHG